MLPLAPIRRSIAQLCQELNVARLDIFGSAVTSRFAYDSDVDVLASFVDHKHTFDRYFSLKERLEQLLDRQVDLVIEDAIRNPYFREAIEENRVNVYTAGYEKAPV
jgi:predicted nucleotidyltransferase